MTQTEVRRFTSWLGKRSYKARVTRLGLERIQEIARENGKKGGRPKRSTKEAFANVASSRSKGRADRTVGRQDKTARR